MKLIMSDCPINIPLDNDSRYIDLSKLKIANCIGCFGCWVKTPGRCVIRDDAATVYPLIGKSDHVIYVSKLKYGGYDTVMKTMLERAIPIQKAFIRLLNGEAHHEQRNVAMKKAVVIAYGEISEEEQTLFKRLIARNAHNMCIQSFDVLFCDESALDEVVEREAAKWGKL